MALGPLVRKELLWVRRHRLALAVAFVVVPALAALATTAFEQAVPRDVPVAVAPASAAVTADELLAIEGVARGVSQPVRFRSVDAARAALDREEVYGVLVVPHGLYAEEGPVTIRFLVQGSVVPYDQPSRTVTAAVRRSAETFRTPVRVERRVVGPRRTLSEYLFSTLPLALLAVYAFTYVPTHLVRERGALDRVRTESSLFAWAATKLLLFVGLAAVLVLSGVAVGAALGYRVDLLAPGALAAMALATVTLVATSAGITVLSGFSTAGRSANVVVLAGLVAFSNLFYPAGFFSALRREVAAWMPLHHAAVVVHGAALRGASLATYADRLLGLLAVAVLAVGWLAATVAVFERRA